MTGHNRGELAAQINAERRQIEFRFRAANFMAAFAFGMTFECSVLAAGNLLGWWQAGPVFLTGTVPGVALAVGAIWLALHTSRKAGHLRARRKTR